MTPQQKSIVVALVVAAVTAIAETAEKIAPEYADSEWAFLFKVIGYTAAAVRLFLVVPKPAEPKE